MFGAALLVEAFEPLKRVRKRELVFLRRSAPDGGGLGKVQDALVRHPVRGRQSVTLKLGILRRRKSCGQRANPFGKTTEIFDYFLLAEGLPPKWNLPLVLFVERHV